MFLVPAPVKNNIKYWQIGANAPNAIIIAIQNIPLHSPIQPALQYVLYVHWQPITMGSLDFLSNYYENFKNSPFTP